MLGGRYGSYYIIRECKTYLNVGNLIDHAGEKSIKTCTYKWKDYAEGADTFEMRTNKHIGQPLVFKREEFLTDHESLSMKDASRAPVIPNVAQRSEGTPS